MNNIQSNKHKDELQLHFFRENPVVLYTAGLYSVVWSGKYDGTFTEIERMNQ